MNEQASREHRHDSRAAGRQTVVVIGNGMVGHRFCEKLVEFDADRRFKIVTFCEEPRAAYDRVGLTSFFSHRDANKLMLARLDWYGDHDIDLHVGDRAGQIDRRRRVVRSDRGLEIAYDRVVIATGSYPFVPPVPGIQQRGVFVYRTIEDLEKIIEYSQGREGCAVIGGGLLGLEAAKAAYDLGLDTHIVECAPRLMPRQIDDAGSEILVRRITELGVNVHLNKMLQEVVGDQGVNGLAFTDGEKLSVETIIVSAGIRPRDELAREAELQLGPRGGIVVDDHLQTTDADIFAIGEVVSHAGTVYGLVAPGYEMAEIVAENLCGGRRKFTGAELSAKLKLMGVDVASFGDYEADETRARPLVYCDPFGGVYKKLVFNHEGTRLLGGVLVGDASEYSALTMLSKSDEPLPVAPGELIVGAGGGATAVGSVGQMADDAQVCSCNNVTKGRICAAIREHDLTTAGGVKSHTSAGAGCGGCVPLVADLVSAELKAAGRSVNSHLCPHFPHSRVDLYEIIRVKRLKTFDEVIAGHGQGHGCEICKPAVTSILANLWNENIVDDDHHTLQDTNDRFLANMQRGGLYSVIPRVPGGEITPDKLITLGTVAKKYDLYTKITGAQRVDLFGAQVQQLPGIWEELVAAGFESGHAYGKALRTVKSCVGTTWCRYGVQDSVAFAIRLEERYKGIRAPHKIKSAVSGCVRECAEAQSKDFGLVATENGYNLYVCGNGGAKPRHGDLLTVDLDEETCVKYIDRFLMYYSRTADKLTRTATWLEKMEGGIERLREVIIDDKLGICDELERQMQFLVDTYKCEWKEVVNDPEKRKWFRQFVNTDQTEPDIEMIAERGQRRPVDWPKDFVGIDDVTIANGCRPQPATNGVAKSWVKVGRVADFPKDGGATVKHGDMQIAVFNFASRGQWYATQNMCPHRQALVLSRGILGDDAGRPKVACPLHKKTFSLDTGECLSGDTCSIGVFPVRVEGDAVYLSLPQPVHQMLSPAEIA